MFDLAWFVEAVFTRSLAKKALQERAARISSEVKAAKVHWDLLTKHSKKNTHTPRGLSRGPRDRFASPQSSQEYELPRQAQYSTLTLSSKVPHARFAPCTGSREEELALNEPTVRFFVVPFIAAMRASLKARGFNSSAVLRKPLISSGAPSSVSSSFFLSLMASWPNPRRATCCKRSSTHR